MTEIQTVGRRRLAVRSEDGHVKIDVLWMERRLATLDIEPKEAFVLEREIREQRLGILKQRVVPKKQLRSTKKQLGTKKRK